MIEPSEWFDLAFSLVDSIGDPLIRPSQASLRRGVSTAYYGLFHIVLRAGAQRFMGIGTDPLPGYGTLYRAFNHGRMKTICSALHAVNLSPALKRQLGRTTISQELRDFAAAFLDLQAARQRADYDPQAIYVQRDAIDLVFRAIGGAIAFRNVAPAEQADVLALMLAAGRD
jgi:hypothetical protein